MLKVDIQIIDEINDRLDTFHAIIIPIWWIIDRLRYSDISFIQRQDSRNQRHFRWTIPAHA